jgi:hypothetical protein
LLFLAFSFSEGERHRMFMSFYREIDRDESLTFEIDETKACFERYASDQRLIGKKKVQRIIEHIGVTVGDNLFSLLEETTQNFSDDVYEDILSQLSKDGKDSI